MKIIGGTHFTLGVLSTLWDLSLWLILMTLSNGYSIITQSVNVFHLLLLQTILFSWVNLDGVASKNSFLPVI